MSLDGQLGPSVAKNKTKPSDMLPQILDYAWEDLKQIEFGIQNCNQTFGTFMRVMQTKQLPQAN